MVFKEISMKQPTAIICLSPYSGGMELDTIKTAKHLSSITKIIVVAKENHFIASKYKEYVGYNNIELETISFNSSLSYSIYKRAKEIITKYNIKNVIFFGASELKSLYFAFLGKDINLLIRHGTTKSTPKKDFFHKLIYSDVAYHIANSQHILNNVKKIIPFGKNTKSILIYPSFEFKSNITYAKQDKLTLLHVGRIAEGKGQLDAIKACEILYKNKIDFHLLIVGGFDKSYEEEFLNFYNTLPYKQNIELVGFSNNVDLYYKQSDIFLFPSHGEGLSNAFIEALSYGINSICYNNTSFPELQELGFKFEISENQHIEALQQKLLRISQHTLDILSDNIALTQKIFSIENELANYQRILK